MTHRRGSSWSAPSPIADSTLSDELYLRAKDERDKTLEALQMFIDWRHKVTVRFMVATAASLAGWHYL